VNVPFFVGERRAGGGVRPQAANVPKRALETHDAPLTGPADILPDHRTLNGPFPRPDVFTNRRRNMA